MSKNEEPKEAEGTCYFFNYYYDKAGRPIVTSCLMEIETIPLMLPTYCRGLAICSSLDFGNLTKKRGRLIAKGRALSR